MQLFKLMTKAEQLLDRLFEGRSHRRIEWRSGQRLTHHRHPQLARGTLQFIHIGAFQRCAPVGAAGLVPLPCIKEQGGVTQRARYHVTNAGTEPALVVQRATGGAITAGLEPDQAAVRRRDTD
ncbi:hypothetical protein D3C77_507160 [compost metagenome]